jgi:hypothetical protein
MLTSCCAPPGYYTCDNNQVKNKGAQRECFKCCRSACIVDEFANGVKKAGFTYKYCDKSCWQYCGYTSARGRMLLSLDEPLSRKQSLSLDEPLLDQPLHPFTFPTLFFNYCGVLLGVAVVGMALNRGGQTSARGCMLLSLAEDAVARDIQVQPPPAETNWRGSVALACGVLNRGMDL